MKNKLYVVDSEQPLPMSDIIRPAFNFLFKKFPSICDWINEKGFYISNYKYLEIQFWSIQFNMFRAACTCFSTNL